MKSRNYLKKLILPNLPYLLFVYLFDKVGQAARLAPGADLSGKLLSISDGFAAAFSNSLAEPSPAWIYLSAFSARCLSADCLCQRQKCEEISPWRRVRQRTLGQRRRYNALHRPGCLKTNVLLTQTERLMMNSRPKQPKYARNKNVLVMGGSGSGKTRGFSSNPT